MFDGFISMAVRVYEYIDLGRLVSAGIRGTQGPISIGGNAIISQWFPPKEQSRAISVMVDRLCRRHSCFRRWPPGLSFTGDGGHCFRLLRSLGFGGRLVELLYPFLPGREFALFPGGVERNPVYGSTVAGRAAMRLPRLLARVLFMGKQVSVAETKAQLFKRPISGGPHCHIFSSFPCFME